MIAQTLLIFVSKAVLAASTPDFTLSLKKTGAQSVLTATPPKEHHFNTKAPMSMLEGDSKIKIKPIQIDEHKVVFKSQALASFFSVTLYLCDDKKTFCKPQTVSTSADSALGSGNAPAPAAAATEKTVRVSNQPNRHGFFVNAVEAATARAKAERKPLLIDFFGIWCPPCNMLDNEVFSTPEFKKKARGFVLLKMDSDLSLSWDLKSKFKVTGYPTVVFATPDLVEISRIIGFLSAEKFDEKMDEALNPKTVAETTKPNDEQAEYDKTIESLSERAANDASLKPQLAEALESYVKKFKGNADIYSSLAETYSEMKNQTAADRNFKNAVEVYENRLKKMPKQKALRERGINLEMAYCLWRSGNEKAAELIYRRLEGFYPSEFTFYHAHSRMKAELKKFAEAKTLSEKAYRFSYGDNRLRVALHLATVSAQLGDKKRARQVIEETLAQTKAPTDPQIRTSKHISKMQDFLKTLN